MKSLAQAQVDFFFHEAQRLYFLAWTAYMIQDWPFLQTVSEQHALAVRRFYDAKQLLLNSLYE